MTASTATIPRARSEAAWLRSQGWDLTWISLSVILVAVPYLAYLAFLNLESLLAPAAGAFGASVESLARNFVNGAVALLVGGPHMYATYTRTFMDRDFARAHPRMIWSSLLIPLVVVLLALLNLSLLLTIFFFWASIHVLHQIVYIVELYNRRGGTALTASPAWPITAWCSPPCIPWPCGRSPAANSSSAPTIWGRWSASFSPLATGCGGWPVEYSAWRWLSGWQRAFGSTAAACCTDRRRSSSP
jgi:hypothetical protein